MDIDDLAKFMQQFGFGKKTGVDIEGELSGILPSREWKRKYFSGSKYREEHRRWIVGDQISVGIGQGFNAYTPLQMAHAMAILANNGVVYKPHLVKTIKNAATGETRETQPKPIEHLKLKEEHIKVIKDAMVGVNQEGTSAGIFKNASYPNGGKTGTAQVYSLKGEKYEADKIDERLRDHAWFIAFAPVDKPTIALAVLVENGGFGAQAAAPIARAVMDYHQLGKPPANKTAELKKS
jgi:penicillin-binding protein 2